MYSYKERKAAVEAYIKNGYNAAATVQELGHPSHTAVVLLYQELREKGCLKKSSQRERQYSEAERRRAVEYDLTYGKSMSQTIRVLGLCKRTPPLVEYTQAQKDAVGTVLLQR